MQEIHTHVTRRGEFLAGAKATIPLVVGAIPFGIIFGALAVTGGLSGGAVMAMSAFVFAGSAQFIAAGLISTGAGTALIILTTFIVNVRHALYSASLAPYMKHLPHRWLLPLGFWLTDESYAVVITRYTQPDKSPYKHWFFFGSALFMYSNWQLCTFIGLIAGQSIPDVENWGLDFAMVVTFIGLVVPLIITRPILIATLVSAATALLFHGLPNQSWLMVAALAGIISGYVAESQMLETTAEEVTP
jgi:4-azaleucine resistance transporter AzlC